MRRHVISLFICFSVATAIVASAYVFSNKLIHTPGNFLRLYHNDIAFRFKEMDIRWNSWYIAGINKDKIFLGNLSAPLTMLITNYTLTDSRLVQIKLINANNIPLYKTARIKVDDEYFYLTDGTAPCVFRGKIGSDSAYRFMYDSIYFDQSEFINSKNLAIRTHKPNLDNVLGKLQQVKPHLLLNDSLLEKQVEGLFSTDGMLRFNKKANTLIYIYYYRNQYIVYDTNLNLLARNQTIDTISHAQLSLTHISSTNTIIATKKVYTNLDCWTSDDYLFIKSNVMARNDIKKIFSLTSVIDVYNIYTNRYLFSFALPTTEKGYKIREFQIHDKKFIIALYDNKIVRYDLKESYF
jgi:hypothetical protein